LENFKEERKF
jgi:hypothetical protein